MGTERMGILFWLAVGLVSIYGATRLGLGALREPGSGFLPFVAGAFISLMALFLLLHSFFRKRGTQERHAALWAGVQWHRPAIISLVTFGFVMVLENLGFLLASFFLLFIL